MKSVLLTGTGSPSSTAPTRQASIEGAFAHFQPSTARLLYRIGALACRRLGLDPLGARGASLTGLISGAIRFAVPVAVTLATGAWSGAPWTRWALVAGALGVMYAIGAAGHQESSPMVRDMTVLMSTMAHDSDVAELSVFTRRWCRLRVSATVGTGVTIIVLGAWTAISPSAMRALPIGTVALLALMLYDLAELSFVLLFMTGPLLAREARYDHKLFRLNPVDALPVQRAIRSWEGSVFVVGLWTTLTGVLAGLLVGLTSPALVTVVAGFTLTGYAATLVSMVVMRSSMRAIVRRVHGQTMEELQRRIETVISRGDHATSEELERMHSLVELYTVVRDARSSPRASHTLAHAAGALAVPTLGFFLAVLSEVYAERLLDQILP